MSELEFFLSTVAMSRVSESQSDEIPDYYTFTLSSIKYFTASANHARAARLASIVFNIMQNMLLAAYNGRVNTQFVLLPQTLILETTSWIAESVLREAGVTYNVISHTVLVPQSPSQLEALAVKLRPALTEKGFSVIFIDPPPLQSISLLIWENWTQIQIDPIPRASLLELSAVRTSAVTAKDSTPPSQSDVELFQVVLWFSILFGLTILYAIYSLAFMDNGHDSILFSKFNPNWGRKNA